MFDRESFRKTLVRKVDEYSSVSAICRKAGINRQQFNKYLSGDNVPSLATTWKIAQVLEIGLEDLIGKANQTRPTADSMGLDRLFHEHSTSEPRIVRPGRYAEISTLDLTSDTFVLSSVVLTREDFGGRFERFGRAFRIDGSTYDQIFRGQYYEGGDKIMIFYVNTNAVNTLGTLCLRRLDAYGPDLVGFKIAHRFDKTREPMVSPVALKYVGPEGGDDIEHDAAEEYIGEIARSDLPKTFALVADYMLSEVRFEHGRLRI